MSFKVLVFLLELQLIAAGNIFSADPSDCLTVQMMWAEMGLDKVYDHRLPSGCCGIPGVFCRGSKVTSIFLRFYNIESSIPSRIGNLKNLKTL